MNKEQTEFYNAQVGGPLQIALKDNEPLQKQIVEIINTCKKMVVAEERERVRGIFDALPRKFWEDQDHAVGGYISKKDLRDLLTALDTPLNKKH